MVLPGGEDHDAPARTCVELLGEALHEEQGGASVDGVGEVELGGCQLLERLPDGAGVVGDDDVEPAERLEGQVDETGGCGRVGEVGTDMGEVPARGTQLDDELLGAPGSTRSPSAAAQE